MIFKYYTSFSLQFKSYLFTESLSAAAYFWASLRESPLKSKFLEGKISQSIISLERLLKTIDLTDRKSVV